MDFLDTNVDDDSICVVYGLDADLIMLSMIRKQNILLLRERTEYNIEGLNCNYIYLHIKLLKRSCRRHKRYRPRYTFQNR